MSDQDNGKVSTLQRPTNDDKNAWKAYWKAQGCPWRTEPEIDAERQEYLTERRAIVPDIEQGIYPFKGIKLSRADVEWLLATHENGRGPVDWSDEKQQSRTGLDMRGADLCQVDLSHLPLACTLGGLRGERWNSISDEQLDMAAIHLESSDLRVAHLEEALLNGAHLEGADLRAAHLEGVALSRSHLEGARFHFANLKKAYLRSANMEKTNLYNAKLEKAFLNEVCLKDTILAEVFLEGAKLDEVILSNEEHIGPWIVDAHWGNVNLAVVEWSQIKMLGDEYVASQKEQEGKEKGKAKRLKEYKSAVRANRQLAVALQSQGLNEDAARFAYRAQKLQRIVFRRQKRFGQYLLSGFLDLLAGYGYHPLRTLFWYILTICMFAVAYHSVWATYHLEKITHHPLSYVGAVIFSITAFHGRGFFLGGDFGYDSLITILAAIEAVIGLIIEFSFIATFTQRFFGR